MTAWELQRRAETVSFRAHEESRRSASVCDPCRDPPCKFVGMTPYAVAALGQWHAGRGRPALGQIEPVVEQPAVARLDEDADVSPALFAGSHDRHATVRQHPHVIEGNDRDG